MDERQEALGRADRKIRTGLNHHAGVAPGPLKLLKGKYMFKSKAELLQTIAELRGQVCYLEGMLKVEQERVKFFEDRGNRYSNIRDHLEKITKDNLLASERLIEALTKHVEPESKA